MKSLREYIDLIESAEKDSEHQLDEISPELIDRAFLKASEKAHKYMKPGSVVKGLNYDKQASRLAAAYLKKTASKDKDVKEGSDQKCEGSAYSYTGGISISGDEAKCPECKQWVPIAKHGRNYITLADHDKKTPGIQKQQGLEETTEEDPVARVEQLAQELRNR